MRRRILTLAAVALAAGSTLLGGALADDPVAQPGTASRPEATAGRILAGFSPGDTEAYVERLTARVERDPRDAEALTLLGLAYQQRARETGDPAFYRLSGNALEQASAADGPLPLIVQARASLANTRHRFARGLALARRAVKLDPLNASAYGALGDALVNLGRYRAGFAAYDRMAVLAPGIASYARVANARELLGRPAAAIGALELALDADSTVPEQVGWTLVQLGNEYFNTGRLTRAADAYRTALRRVPGYVHAEAGLARVEAAQGRYGPAIRRLRHVVDVLPLPAYVIMLADTLHVSGDEAGARREYALVGALERIFEANGVRTELQTALFDLDHDRDVAGALRRARAARSAAPGIYADDVLAWALFKSRRCGEARRYSKQALRLGTRDALLVFHRAMIERCLGHTATAQGWFRRALELNPHFSLLWAPVARKALR
jgi:tetratricopeptide (TPR) repeat protein